MPNAPEKRPIFAAGRKRYWRGWASPAYPRAPWVQMFLVTFGGGQFLCGAQSLAARPGTLVLLGPDVGHAWRTDHPKGIGYYVIIFREWDPARVEALLEAEACRAIELSGEVYQAFGNFYERLEMEFEFRDRHTPAVARAIRDAMWALLERALDAHGSRWVRFSEPVRRARHYLRELRHGSPSAEDAARAAGISPSHLRALFRKETGTTPKAFHLAQKLEAAKDMLLSTDLPLKVIAERLGFPSVHPFTTFFHARAGLPPGQWRKKNLAPERIALGSPALPPPDPPGKGPGLPGQGPAGGAPR